MESLLRQRGVHYCGPKTHIADTEAFLRTHAFLLIRGPEECNFGYTLDFKIELILIEISGRA